MSPTDDTGVWLIGARGSVATTTIVGAAALGQGLVDPVGVVTELPELAQTGLPDVARFVFGGHDVATTPLGERAQALVRDGVVPAGLPEAVAAGLDAAEESIRPGVDAADLERPPLETIARLRDDVEDFRARHSLARVVVVNVASTDALPPSDPAHSTLAALDTALADGRQVLSATGLYAYAALAAGCPFVDFTPSLGTRVPALFALARARGVPYAGSDGKTGETFLKTALAPAFAARALRVRSWTGMNVLGGGDGEALSDPARARSKLRSKGRALGEILGYEVEAPVHIEYVADLGEWKTAWDHISFEGFLGTRMRMQFVWEGCDSALAAPLVIDLARLAARAHAAGESGPLPQLAFFFKDPVGTSEHRLETQFATLCDWARRLAEVEAPA